MASRRIFNALAGVLALIASPSFSASAGPFDLGPNFGLNAIPWGIGAQPLSPEEAPETAGIPCSIGAPPWTPPWERRITAQILPWPSVWFGHFSGGRPDPVFYGEVDWRDERICFATKARCQSWIAGMRRAFHRPEGYWTCTPLR